MAEIIKIADRAQWLALRQQDITASDIGSVCGVNPYRTALRVYAEKKGLIAPDPENDIMRRGRWLEPGIMEALRETYPSWDIRKADTYLRLPEQRLGATPDFVVVDPDRPGFGNVQGKIVARRVFNDPRSGWKASEDAPLSAPLHYQLQTLTEAMLLGASWAKIAVLVCGEFSADLVTVEVDLHADAWARVQGEVAWFWRHFDADTPPPVDPARDAETIERLYPVGKPDMPALNLADRNELPGLLDERETLKSELKSVKDRVDARVEVIDATLQALMGEAEMAALPGWRVQWKNEPRRGYTVEPKNPRVLRIKRVALPSAADFPTSF